MIYTQGNRGTGMSRDFHGCELWLRLGPANLISRKNKRLCFCSSTQQEKMPPSPPPPPALSPLSPDHKPPRYHFLISALGTTTSVLGAHLAKPEPYQGGQWPAGPLLIMQLAQPCGAQQSDRERAVPDAPNTVREAPGAQVRRVDSSWGSAGRARESLEGDT